MTSPNTPDIATELQTELQGLTTFKRFLHAVAKETNPSFSDIRRYAKSGLPAPWQNPDHALHLLFRLEALSDSERQLLLAHHTSRQNPNFPWQAFANALALEQALTLTLWTLFGFTDAFHRQKKEVLHNLLQMRTWGDAAFWRKYIALGARCSWALSRMRAELDEVKNDATIAAPIRLLLNSRSWITTKYEIPHNHKDREYLKELAPPLDKNEASIAIKALQTDAPHVAEIVLSITNLTRPMLLRAALGHYDCPRLLGDWLQKYSPDELGLSYGEMIILACLGRYHPEQIKAIVRAVEQQQPGIARTVVDRAGNNLLWITGPATNAICRNTDLLKFYIRELGISPLQKNPQGICYADLDLIATAANMRSCIIGLDDQWPPLSDLDFWTSDALAPPSPQRPRQTRKSRQPASVPCLTAPPASTP